MDIDWYDVAEIRAIQIADLRAEVDRLRASLAAVTAERDEARVQIEVERRARVDIETEVERRRNLAESQALRVVQAETALAASVRREDAFGLLAEIRAKGWSVAVHNDYRQSGQQYTFWLFTKEGRAVKGEGEDDCAALANVRLGIEPVVLRDLTAMDAGTAETKP